MIDLRLLKKEDMVHILKKKKKGGDGSYLSPLGSAFHVCIG